MTARAQSIGVLGVVLDGRCRDLSEHRDAHFPVRPTCNVFCAQPNPESVQVFSRGHSTLGQSPFTRPSELQIPLTISDPTLTAASNSTDDPAFPSVTINPGDLILADLDGVVVVSPEMAEGVCEIAQKGKAIDEKCMEDLKQGRTIAETFKEHRGK